VIKIRQAKIQDLDQIHKIEVKVFEKEAFSKSYLKYLLLNFPDFFIVAEKNDILGYISASVENTACHILSIAVIPEYRRKGIGSMLLNYLIKIAKEKGLNSIILEVKENNMPAINLYKKFNFKQIGYRKNYYLDGKDAIVMKLELN